MSERTSYNEKFIVLIFDIKALQHKFIVKGMRKIEEMIGNRFFTPYLEIESGSNFYQIRVEIRYKLKRCHQNVGSLLSGEYSQLDPHIYNVDQL